MPAIHLPPKKETRPVTGADKSLQRRGFGFLVGFWRSSWAAPLKPEQERGSSFSQKPMTKLANAPLTSPTTRASIWKKFQQIELFKSATESFLRDISSKLQTKLFPANETIIRQGDEGGCMYFLLSGSAEVLINDLPVATLVKGGIFGEMALISGEKRSASIRTLERTVVQRLSKADFDNLRRKYPEFDRHVETLAKQRQQANQMIVTVPA